MNLLSVSRIYRTLSYNLLLLYGILFGVFMVVILLWVYINITIGRRIHRRGVVPEEASSAYVSDKEVAAYFQISVEEVTRRKALEWIDISADDNVTLDKIKKLRMAYKAK